VIYFNSEEVKKEAAQRELILASLVEKQRQSPKLLTGNSFVLLILIKELQLRIQGKGWKLEWEYIRRDLEALYQVELEDGGKTYYIRTDLVGIYGMISQATGAAVPSTVREKSM